MEQIEQDMGDTANAARAASPSDLSPYGSSCQHSIAIADLIAAHRHANRNWTPENDGATHDLADMLCVALMSDCGLTKADATYLMEEVI